MELNFCFDDSAFNLRLHQKCPIEIEILHPKSKFKITRICWKSALFLDFLRMLRCGTNSVIHFSTKHDVYAFPCRFEKRAVVEPIFSNALLQRSTF